MLRMILMTFSLIVAVAVISAANLLPINNSTTGEIANRLPVLFTPANYVFFILPIIYFFLAYWLFKFPKTQTNINYQIINRRVFLFIMTSLFSVIWIFLWHYEFFNLSIIVMAALLTTLIVFYFTYPNNNNAFSGRVPIAIYLGWIVITFIVNISYVLTLHEWNGWGLSLPLWTVIYLTIAAAIALHFVYHYRDIAFSLVFVWVFIGIAVKNGFEELFVSAASLFLAVVIMFFILFPKKESISEK